MTFSFGISEIQRHDAVDLEDFWLTARTGSGADEARFSIWLRAPEEVEEDFIAPIAFSNGYFRRVPGSNPGRLLHALRNALDVQGTVAAATREDILPFEFIFMGPPAERDPEGGFSDEPGDWILTKLFLADGHVEIFFNFNLATGEGEFVPKAPEYADIFVRELSKILW
ncbi:hypothetical protein GCM10007874_60710 [Labrys miyagiensis]|uniref:Uncharacterized protein n=1 Tax=Labrys miyagiensis TaxID=346912 RepID=A0ABQ6CRP4_9HYPH|nr:hypothetical protein [Labrys miyagiensis]GLS23051.1 hypothetical protein GCM10007874_60710 [Labrys miyagiensis]